MTKARIAEVTANVLTFEDGSRIVCDHEQDCCEWNYADFEQVDDLARAYSFDLDDMHFEYAPGGFRFGDSRRMFFVPCYSNQNGYYSSIINVSYETLCRGYRMSVLVLDAIRCTLTGEAAYEEYDEYDEYDDENEERYDNYGNVISFRPFID
jgi:hypothetical protein